MTPEHTPKGGGQPDGPLNEPRKSDADLTLDAASSVLAAAIQIENPYTKALYLESAATMYREHGVVVQSMIPHPPSCARFELETDE